MSHNKNIHIMKATIQNFITIFTPLTDKLVAIINRDLAEDDRPLLTKKSIEFIKLLSVSKFLNMAERYILPTDTIIETDFNLGRDGKVEGHISFERDGKRFYLNTQCIIASGEIQCPHYRYILGATNAPKLHVNPITESVKLMNKLSKYVYGIEETKEEKKIIDLIRSIRHINKLTSDKNAVTDLIWWRDNVSKVSFSINVDGCYDINGYSNYVLMGKLMGLSDNEIESRWDKLIEDKNWHAGIHQDIKEYVEKFYTLNPPTKQIENSRKRFNVSQAKKIAKIESQIEDLKAIISEKMATFESIINGNLAN